MPAERAGQSELRVVRLIVLLGMGTAAAVLLTALLWPLLPAIVTSAVAAVLVYPAHRRLERWLGWSNVAAFLSTVAVFLLILLPLLSLSVLVIDHIRASVTSLSAALAGSLAPEGALAAVLQRITGYLGLDNFEIAPLLATQLEFVADLLARRTLTFLSGLGGWLIQAGAALFTLFYLLRDAGPLSRTLVWLIPLEPAQSRSLLERAREVTYATMYGSVLVAAVQGLLGGLAFALAGIPAAPLWGAFMALLSLLPVVGPPIVWLPAGLLLIASGRVLAGILLLVFGTLVISTIDNLLRALFVSGRAQLHPLVIFLSVLGGIFVFGAAGVFLGPVLFVLAFTLLDMARTALGQNGEGQPERFLLLGAGARARTDSTTQSAQRRRV